MLTNSKYDSKHLHTKVRTGGLQTVSFIHSLSDGKVSVEYFLCARYCGEYGDPRKTPGFEEFKGRKDRSKKIIRYRCEGL